MTLGNFELTNLIDKEIIDNEVVKNLLSKINEFYKNNIKNTTEFTIIQPLIEDINQIFTRIISKITTARELLTRGYGDYEMKALSHDNYKIIRKPNDPTALDAYDSTNPKEANELFLKITNEYKYAEQLLNGLEDSVRALFNLIPCRLDNPYIDKSLNHRNNLFIATNVLGYMNTKLVDFNLKNDTYLQNKLNILTKYWPDNIIGLAHKKDLEDVMKTMEYLMPYYKKTNIFSITQAQPAEYHIPDADATAKKITKFIYPISHALTYPFKQERCLIWTYPLFNFNYGLVTRTFTIVNQPSLNIVKNIIMRFIKDNYTIPTPPATPPATPPHFLKQTIINAISKNLDTTVQTIKNIKANYIANISNYKFEITNAYKTIITLMKKYNDGNQKQIKDMLDNYFTAPTTLTAPLTLKTAITNDQLNDKLGNLMNNIINNFANISNMRQLVIQYIIQIFQKYVIYLHKSGNHSISLNQFERVLDDFYTKSGTGTIADYALSIYISKLLLILNENKDIDDLNDITKLIDYYEKVYTLTTTAPLTVNDNIKLLTNYDILNGLSNITELSRYTNNPTSDFYNEFKYINPQYFEIMMKTYSKIITKFTHLSTPPTGLTYDHNHVVDVLTDNMLSLNINDVIDVVVDLSGKTPNHGTILDLVKANIFIDKIVKYKSNKYTELLKIFNNKIKEIFTSYKGTVSNFILVGGGDKDVKRKRNSPTRKLSEFIPKYKKSKYNKSPKRTKYNTNTNSTNKSNGKKSITYHSIN
jgi:hypothetical protein